jgi:hypothetical protein
MNTNCLEENIRWTIHGLPQRVAKSKAETSIAKVVDNEKKSLDTDIFLLTAPKNNRKATKTKKADKRSPATSEEQEATTRHLKRSFDETKINSPTSGSKCSPETEIKAKKRRVTRPLNDDIKNQKRTIKGTIKGKQMKKRIKGAEELTHGKKASDRKIKKFPEKPSRYTTILKNVYVNRKPRKLSEDEIAVCNCVPKPAAEGSNKLVGCTKDCVNRMLNIECTPDYCPCGDKCTNQQFQQRKYCDLILFYAGRKGWGVKAGSDIKAGQFIIEYVGEVISIDEALRRMGLDKNAIRENEMSALTDSDSESENFRTISKKRLKSFMHRSKSTEDPNTSETPKAKKIRHFYTLTLTGNECIDASRKGNLARFINHSCNPNAITQKWLVLGEIRVGIFALRDIKKGEEITFDYQFERFGAFRQKCFCGSENCRKYLCAKPTNKDVEERPQQQQLGSKTRTPRCWIDNYPHAHNFLRNVPLLPLRPLNIVIEHQHNTKLKSIPHNEDNNNSFEVSGRSEGSDDNESVELIVPPIVNKTEWSTAPLFLRRNVAKMFIYEAKFYRFLLYKYYEQQRITTENERKQRLEKAKKQRIWTPHVSFERLIKRGLVTIEPVTDSNDDKNNDITTANKKTNSNITNTENTANTANTNTATTNNNNNTNTNTNTNTNNNNNNKQQHQHQQQQQQQQQPALSER